MNRAGHARDRPPGHHRPTTGTAPAARRRTRPAPATSADAGGRGRWRRARDVSVSPTRPPLASDVATTVHGTRSATKPGVGIERIGIMTGGGDCPGLNAVIRAVVYKATELGWKVLGIEDATSGLIDLEYRSPWGNRWLTPPDVEDILIRGGTILGTSSRSDPFEFVVEQGSKRVATDVSDRCVANAETLGLDAIISVGGDRQHADRQRPGGQGPQDRRCTQDDRPGPLPPPTTRSASRPPCRPPPTRFDRLMDYRPQATTRVLVLEVMGRDAGWISRCTRPSPVGAHVCLIPESPLYGGRAWSQRSGRGVPWAIRFV